MNLKITKNDTIKLPIGQKYIEEDVTISIDVKGSVNIPQTKIIFNDSLDVSQNFEYDCYFSIAGGYPVGSKLRCENGVLSTYNETYEWINFYTSDGFVEAACQGAILSGEYSAELMEWLIKNSKFGSEVLSEKVITENGTYDVLGYHKALVNVPKGLSKEFIEGTELDIIIPSGTSKIAEGTFAYSLIKSVVIPGSVTSIDKNGFYYCKSLESITLNNGLETIQEYAFRYCSNSNLTKIFIPKTVTAIEDYAFGGMTYTTELDLSEHTTIPTIKSHTLPPNLTKIKVSSSMLSQFKAATNWSAYADIMTSS